MTRWLVTGASGMLGLDLQSALTGRDITAPPRSALDLSDSDAVDDAVAGKDVVVNCAAWTAVDEAESHEAAAFAVNATAVAGLARSCARHGASLLQISTDYVFDGESQTAYLEDAPLAPCSAYGRTKAAGEWAIRAELPDRHWILRTAWLYGEHGPNFVRTMARLESERDTVDVVNDQHGQPTWTRDLAERIVSTVERAAPGGTYHATSSGETTWFGLARAVFELLGADPERVHPVTSAAFARPAPRPARSVLGHDGWSVAGLPPMRFWREALEQGFPSVAGRTKG